MNFYVIRQHLARAWSRHWPLQVASVTVMTVVLLILNLLFLSFTAFNQMVGHWGKALEMIVYVREDAGQEPVEKFHRLLEVSGYFEAVQYISKSEATKKFLSALGSESLE